MTPGNPIPAMQFVKAFDEDVPYLLELRKLTMAEHLSNAGANFTDEMHAARVLHRFDSAFLIWLDGQRAGLIKYFEAGSEITILQVQVHPEFQGQGIGKRAVERVQEEASALGSSVFLTVLKENPARRLYERLGFVTVGEDEFEFHMRWLPQ